MSARVAADDHELTQSRAVRCRAGASQIYVVNQGRPVAKVVPDAARRWTNPKPPKAGCFRMGASVFNLAHVILRLWPIVVPLVLLTKYSTRRTFRYAVNSRT
jgi:antitoxin (DNA-binding transcriptional repressor) of toxin-antitoxin stability system